MLARIAGFCVLLGFVIGLVSGFLLLAAAGFDFEKASFIPSGCSTAVRRSPGSCAGAP
jgi:hypothetical protein